MSTKSTPRSKQLPNRLRNHLRGMRDSFAALSSLRQSVDDSNLPQLADWLPFTASSEPSLFDRKFPRKYSALGKGRLLLPVTLNRETRWAVYLLSQDASALNDFVRVRGELDNAVFTGRYEIGSKLLNELEVQYGYSIWSIERRIALLSLSEGLEGQKQYSASINQVAPGSFAAFCAYYISRRIEPTVNPLRFQSDFVDTATRWNIGEDFRVYINYLLANVWPVKTKDIADILRFAARTSVIDYYNALVTCSANAACQVKNLGAFIILAIGLEQISTLIQDVRVQRTLFLRDNEVSRIPSTDITAHPALQPFWEGNRREALVSCAAVSDPISAEISAKIAAEDPTLVLAPDGSLLGQTRRLPAVCFWPPLSLNMMNSPCGPPVLTPITDRNHWHQ
jgi:hypothetical protein